MKTLALLLIVSIGCCAEEQFTTVVAAEHPPSPHLQVRRTTSDPFTGDDNVVHNTPSPHRSWMARHPRIMGALAIGAAAGVGAGIARSQHRGICREGYPGGYVYVGTCPLPADH